MTMTAGDWKWSENRPNNSIVSRAITGDDDGKVCVCVCVCVAAEILLSHQRCRRQLVMVAVYLRKISGQKSVVCMHNQNAITMQLRRIGLF
jgi:hypothetical protein